MNDRCSLLGDSARSHPVDAKRGLAALGVEPRGALVASEYAERRIERGIRCNVVLALGSP